MFWVYILECSDKSFYTDHSDNLEQRIAQHEAGYFSGCYTSSRRPLTLKFSQEFESRELALASERQIKGWSRKKKQAMIDQDWDLLKALAKKRN